jgi:Tfp pilus assembly protein PilW
MNRPVNLRAMAGFSLVEMMVALVAGMVVVGAVLAFTVSSVRANSDYVQSTRLMQELRNVTDYMTVELKRAGYDDNAMYYVANPTSTAVSKFAPMKIDPTVSPNCILYAYDRSGSNLGGLDLANGELRGIRRRTTRIGTVDVGVIEVAESSSTATPACDGAQPDYSAYPVDCNATSGWCPLSDPKTLDVQAFTISTTASGTNSNGVSTTPGGPTYPAIQMRELQLTLTGNLRSDASVTRTVRSNVKVRADCLRSNITACTNAPAP